MQRRTLAVALTAATLTLGGAVGASSVGATGNHQCGGKWKPPCPTTTTTRPAPTTTQPTTPPTTATPPTTEPWSPIPDSTIPNRRIP